MRFRFTKLSLATISVAAVAQAASAAIPTIYPLGIAAGDGGSRGYAINDSGQVAVTSFDLFGGGAAGRYDGAAPGGTLRNLGTLPGGLTAYAQGINASGQVAGYSQGATTFTPSHAIRYDGTPGAGGVMRDLGTLGGPNSKAFAINDLGQVVGDAETDPNGADHGFFAFFYTGTPGAGGVMTNLGSLGGSGSVATAINNAGQIAGSSPAADGSTRVFRYDGLPGTGIMRDLGLLPGATGGFGYGINASGKVVGEMDSDVSQAFVYSGTPGVDGMMTGLPGLPDGHFGSAASINDADFVLGISTDANDDYFYPVLWRPDGSIVDLNAWLSAANPELAANWDLRNPNITSINNSGLITGSGIYLGSGPLNGQEVAFVLDASSLVPEPANLTMLAGALLLMRRKR